MIAILLISALIVLFTFSFYFNHKTEKGFDLTNFREDCTTCAKTDCALNPNYMPEGDDDDQ